MKEALLPFWAMHIWKWEKKVSLMNETMNDLVNESQEIQSIKDKGILPKIVSFCYSTLYPEANYALYHILRAWEAAGCTLPSLNTDFRTGQCRYFFQVGMNLSIEVRLGMPLALVESRDTQKGLCSYVSKVLYSLLSIWIYAACTISKHFTFDVENTVNYFGLN